MLLASYWRTVGVHAITTPIMDWRPIGVLLAYYWHTIGVHAITTPIMDWRAIGVLLAYHWRARHYNANNGLACYWRPIGVLLACRMNHSGNPQNDSKWTHFARCPDRYILVAKVVPKVGRQITASSAHIPLQTLTSFLTEWLRNNYSSRRKRLLRASVTL